MACTVGELRNSITTLYQPIMLVGLNERHPVGAEALSRGVNLDFGDVDEICVEQALCNARQLPPYLDVFINVHPNSLTKDCAFPDMLAEKCRQYGIDMARVVVEVLDHDSMSMVETRQLRTTLRILRSLGGRLAVDDVKNAAEALDKAIDLAPDYIKVDGQLISAGVFDAASRVQIGRIVSDAQRIGAAVIAEGIEYPARMEVALEAGIRLLQGHYLGRPVPAGSLLRTTKDM